MSFLQLYPRRPVIVEPAVDGRPDPAVFIGEGLAPRFEIDDRQPRVAEADAPVGRDPRALTIRAAVCEASDRRRDHVACDGPAA